MIPPSITRSFTHSLKHIGTLLALEQSGSTNKVKYTREPTQETSQKILAYLMDNPDAQDTLRGIVDWWLLQQDIKRNVALIRKALDGLLQKGFLLERQGDDRTKYYQVNRKRLPEISALIEQR